MNSKVLMVDDDVNVLEAYGRVLRRAGYDVDTASTGEDALELVDCSGYDAVVLDMRMPGMDGITFLRVLRERESAVPVMLLTGSLTAENAALAINLGVARCLMKPINARELTEGVTLVIQPQLETIH